MSEITINTEPKSRLKISRRESRLARIGVTAVEAMSALSLIVISGLALCYTCHYPFTDGQLYNERQDVTSIFSVLGIGEIAASVLVAVLLIALLLLFWKTRLGRISPKKLLPVIMAYALVFQLAWIIQLNTDVFTYIDTLNLMDAAKQLEQGNISAFQSADSELPRSGAAQYFTLYPFQSGSLFVFYALYNVFGEQAYSAFQIINALANSLVVPCLYAMTKLTTKSTRATNLCLVLTAACLPLFFSCVLVYGNTLGLLFSCAGLVLLIFALKNQGSRRLVIVIASILLIGLAMLFKSTSILYLIAAGIVLLLFCLAQRDWKLALCTILCALFVNQAVGLTTFWLEKATDADFGKGMPKTSWIAMGLREDNVLQTPGWWGFYPSDLFYATNGDYDQQNKEALESISNSIATFVGDPLYGIRFIKAKLVSEWSDPAYQTLYYSTACVSDNVGNRDYGRFATSVLYGTANKPLLLFLDGYQLIICVFAASRCVRILRAERSDIKQAVIPIVILIGFGVYLLWEAKSVYTLPFFVLMIPLAAAEANRLFETIDAKQFNRTADKRS